jgi:hypothetical protein
VYTFFGGLCFPSTFGSFSLAASIVEAIILSHPSHSCGCAGITKVVVVMGAKHHGATAVCADHHSFSLWPFPFRGCETRLSNRGSFGRAISV